MWGGLPSIRPEERRGVVAAFLTLFGILAAHTILETARDALFLARLPAKQLPWVYLLIAAVAVGISQLPLGGRRLLGRRGLSLLLVSFSIPTFVFWATASWRSPAALYALYVWTGVVGSMAVLEFYMVLGETYTLTQAKRIYRLVGTGSLLGAAAGAIVANVLARSLSTPSLVPAAATTLALTGLGPALLLKRPDVAATPQRAEASLTQAWTTTRNHPYVRGLAVLMLISTVALTLTDYVFKSVVSQRLEPAAMGPFFATVYMVLNVLALGVQLVLTGWLFRLLGLHRALWALPALLFLGSLGVILGGGIVAALVLKGADGALRNSVHRTGSELLYVPLPDALRGRAKPLIDVLGQRGGQALASLLILSEVSLNRGEGVLAAAAAACSLVWIAWTADLKGHYLDLFRAALRAGSIGPKPDLPPLDLGSLEALFNALNSPDDAEVIGAMDLLAEEKRTHLIPALILYHPSRPVVLRALVLFARAERTDFLPVADRLLSHQDAELRAAALRARTAVKSDHDKLQAAMTDPSPLVQSTALVGLVSSGWISDELQPMLDALLASRSRDTWAGLASAIGAQPASVFEHVLLELVELPDETVQRQTAYAMGAIGSESFLAPLLHLLAHWETRGPAREALLAFGPRGLEFLKEALAEEALPHEVRRQLPMTIAQFPAVDAAGVLLPRLLAEPDGMVRFKILRGLNHVGRDPDVALDPGVLREATESTLRAAFQLVDWRFGLVQGARAEPRRKTPGHELLVTLLHDKEVHATERLFRLLALQFRHEDFKDIYRGLWNQSAKVRSSSRELLENLIEPPLRGALLALVDDAPDGDRLRRAAPYYLPQPRDYETLIGIILEQPGESLPSIAAYHVGELGLRALRPELEKLKPAETGFFLARVVERALALLSAKEGGALAPAR